MQAEQLKDLVINALEDVKAQDISVIDVRDRTSVTDFMVLASGTSNRHVKSLADSVVIEAKEQGVRASNVEGAGVSDWILVDLGDVVVHVMMPATRSFTIWSASGAMLPILVLRAANNHAVTPDLRGQKMPDWVSTGFGDYARRMPPELPVELVEIPVAHRGKIPTFPD